VTGNGVDGISVSGNNEEIQGNTLIIMVMMD
jgi:hypothetical protein